MFCPFCEAHIQKSDLFEYTLKSILKIVDYFEHQPGDTGSSETPDLLMPSKLKIVKPN